MKKVMFVVQRVSNDCKTVAIVTSQVDHERMGDESNFFSSLMAAVTEWVRTTTDGKKALKNSAQDFNVGDLTNEQPFSHIFTTILAKHGIRELNIKTYDQATMGYWQYDDALVDTNEL